MPEDPVTNKSIDEEVELRSKGRVYRVYISTEVAMYKESLRNHKIRKWYDFSDGATIAP